jgi:[acyl-carrier-protein] S-malonyltransferase
MADPWDSHEAGHAVLARLSEVWGRDAVATCRDEDALSRTDVVQAALYACDLAAFRVLEAEGARFDAAAGHSLGEFVALAAAGALDEDDAFRVVLARGRAMQAASEASAGAMTALIGMSLADAADVCHAAGRGDVLEVANENGPKQVVLSGSVGAVERAEEAARSRGAKAIRLRVAGAFHSPLMRPALEPLRDAISRVRFREPRMAVVPNASGRPTTEPSALRDLLSRHLVSPVRWERSMRALGDAGVEAFVEAGPGDVLTKLVRRIVAGARTFSAGDPDGAKAAAAALHEDEKLETSAPSRKEASR